MVEFLKTLVTSLSLLYVLRSSFFVDASLCYLPFISVYYFSRHLVKPDEKIAKYETNPADPRFVQAPLMISEESAAGISIASLCEPFFRIDDKIASFASPIQLDIYTSAPFEIKSSLQDPTSILSPSRSSFLPSGFNPNLVLVPPYSTHLSSLKFRI